MPLKTKEALIPIEEIEHSISGHEHTRQDTQEVMEKDSIHIHNIIFIVMIQIYNTIMKPPQLFSHHTL
jgi:hypothetical protein